MMIMMMMMMLRMTITSMGGVVWAIYGYDRPTAAELAELQEVVKGLVIQARSFGDLPALLAGDLNATLDECAFLKGLARGGWRDLGRFPTCMAAQSRDGRRIDLSVANPAFGQLVGEYVTHWELGLPTHAVQQWSAVRRSSAMRPWSGVQPRSEQPKNSPAVSQA